MRSSTTHVVMAICLSASTVVRANAQVADHPVYFGVSAGAAVEEGEVGIRSSVGPVIALTVGGRVRDHFAIEAEATGVSFGGGDFISPGGCPGALQCHQPTGPLRAVSVGGDAVFSARAAVAPFLAVGAGVRHLGSSPDYDETRSYTEFGAGVVAPVIGHLFSVETRVQLAAASGTFPTWMVPITVGIRF